MGIELTSARLKELLHYDTKTGLFTWKVSRGRVKAGTIAGTLDSKGYSVIAINGKVYKAHRLAWLYTFDIWPKSDLDHINQVKSDNCIENLREVSKSENQQNRNIKSKSGFRGVTWSKQSGKWHAQIVIDYKYHHLGFFDHAEDASRAYQAAAKKLHTHRPTEIA